MDSDADIMKRVQAGEDRLFEKLAERYQSRLLRFAASKFASLPLAEELVQETFLAAYAARADYSPRFAFSTWIWTILLNLSRRESRRQRRRAITLSTLAAQQPAARAAHESPLETLLRAERRELVLHWLELLPEEEADAIRLRFFGGLKFEEIAAAMNSSLGAAKNRVKRGLLRLTERMQREEI